MQKNKNRQGYKKTKVGWIPEDWDASTLGETVRLLTGFPFKSRLYTESANDIRLLRGDNVGQGQLRWENAKYWPRKQVEDLKKYQLRKGDLVIAMDRTWVKAGLKVACIRDDDLPCLLVQRVARLRANRELDQYFMVVLIYRHHFEQYVKGVQTETAVPHISPGDIRELPIPLPPLPEQKEIAEVLECWDKTIRNYEKKIEKKRHIKKGLMQRLLSGKQRLPGFSGEWKVVQLGEIFSFVRSHAFSREFLTTPDTSNANIYNIHYGDIHATYDGCILDFNEEDRIPLLKTDVQLPDNVEFLQNGDLVMADASEDYEGVGACIELVNLESKKVTGGLHTFVLRDSSGITSAGYRGYMFSEYALAKELKRIASGISVYSVSKTNLAKVDLTLPPTDEQQAIAGILSAVDDEIKTLENKLTTLREQKRFLLNNMVTGTIRLPQFCNHNTDQKEAR